MLIQILEFCHIHLFDFKLWINFHSQITYFLRFHLKLILSESIQSVFQYLIELLSAFNIEAQKFLTNFKLFIKCITTRTFQKGNHLIFLLFNNRMQDTNQEDNFTLIYHNFRGMAQNIRYVLFYLNFPFNQLVVKNGQDPSSLEIVKKCKFSGELQLPCLVYKETLINDCFAIIRYLCTKAKRQDLLGSTLEERTIIREIYYNYLLTKKKAIVTLFKFGQEAEKYPGKKEEIRKKALQYSHRESGSLIQTATLKIRNPGKRYIFGHITILDFLFYEESFYQINLFGNLEQKNCKFLDTINSIFGTELSDIKDKSTIYLRVMRDFKENFEKEPFYLNNKQRLESYTVLSPSMGSNCKQAFRGVWLGPGHYVE